MAFQLAGMALQPVIDIVLDKSGLGRGFDRLLNPNKYEEIRKQRKENNILEKQAQQQDETGSKTVHINSRASRWQSDTRDSSAL